MRDQLFVVAASVISGERKPGARAVLIRLKAPVDTCGVLCFSGCAMKLATMGYGMLGAPPKGVKKAILFKQCLLDAQVDLLLDARFNVWGGYWSPHEIGGILQGSPVRYMHEADGINLHQLFGVPKAMRDLRPFERFAAAYRASLRERKPDPIITLKNFLTQQQVAKLAILCCEAFVPTMDNCHRFVLADILVAAGVAFGPVENLSMDATLQNWRP
jgi:hypothetical protein